MQQRTLGHDSEMGLSQGGEIVSALDVFNEEVFEDEHGRYFADNMNCEIAINPVSTLADFHKKTEGLLNHIRDRGLTPVMEQVIRYPERCMKHPLSMVSGCDPDFSAYFQEKNLAPDFTQLDSVRSCGGHMHASLDGASPYWYARWMDALVALPLLKFEQNTGRRELYGKAGCLREKPYGGEYRTLSNVWVEDPARREFVWEMTNKAAELAKTTDPATIDEWWDIPTAIDTHDLDLAQKCIDRLHIFGGTQL